MRAILRRPGVLLLACVGLAWAPMASMSAARAQSHLRGGGGGGGAMPAPAAPHSAAPARIAPSASGASGLGGRGLGGQGQGSGGVQGQGLAQGTTGGSAFPVAPVVPGVLSNQVPPRYDSLALGHAQYADQPPPPSIDVPVGRNGGLSAGYGQGGAYGRGTVNGNGGAYGGYGDGAAGYPVPYPVEGSTAGGRQGRGATAAPFGSSAVIDGE